MKALKPAVIVAFLIGALTPAFAGRAVDNKPNPNAYPLRTCVVSGEKLGGDMGDPYVFIYKDPNIKDDPGREVRLCCKSCLEDFKKDPAKYLQKIDDARAKLKK